MKLSLILRAHLRAAAAALAAVAAAHETDTIVRVENGFLKGAVDAATIRFQDVPYAAPPLGRLRWAPPEPRGPWGGVRDATQPTQPCAQVSDEKEIDNEDCLYLQVTVPRFSKDGERKPVMVWIHGGGMSSGSGSDYDARRMSAQSDVIVVTVDFRLNVFGFFARANLAFSGSFGLLDQQAAVGWVKRNIAAFGGDVRLYAVRHPSRRIRNQDQGIRGGAARGQAV